MRQEQIREAWFPIGDLPNPGSANWRQDSAFRWRKRKTVRASVSLATSACPISSRISCRNPPAIVTPDGRVVGRHRGFTFTPGQRRASEGLQPAWQSICGGRQTPGTKPPGGRPRSARPPAGPPDAGSGAWSDEPAAPEKSAGFRPNPLPLSCRPGAGE
ncbi:MAG: hypothetical protein R3F31_14695 [Verrucomicrobiales bacterium]